MPLHTEKLTVVVTIISVFLVKYPLTDGIYKLLHNCSFVCYLGSKQTHNYN